MEKIISGIQQIGIGVRDAEEAWRWYRQHFGLDIPVFKDTATASLMACYTDNQPQKRYAILAINIQGGGGVELWQYLERKPKEAGFEIQLGDYGIFAAKIKCKNIQATYTLFQSKKLTVLGEISKTPEGKEHFFLKDPYGNIFEILSSDYWFTTNKCLCGGIEGCIIGVSDMEKSKEFYKEVLGYDTVLYDLSDKFDDLAVLAGGNCTYRRVLLTHSKARKGNFSRLLGSSVLELVQVLDRNTKQIYENRYWGDLGFIHLCYDISGMKHMEKECAEKGYPFTVNSQNTFDMGAAGGHFSYTEDPDATLIEFIETHRVPIIKKIGWYLNLKKRVNGKALPNWMVIALAWGRVKA